ncbi:hypothetical protein IKF84_00035 [Candidatus Saccharibacteria bacterium]|nr:hypothetical protein [Candidatus Saccharibacteria bacterium]
MYRPVIVDLTDEDKELIRKLADKQTELYGHDRGYFRLGRSDSSHEIGFEGEVAFVRWAHDVLGLEIDKEVGLNEFGAKYDVYMILDGVRYDIHIKTGRWTSWPQESYYFGVHYGQKIEDSGAPVVLMSYLKNDDTHIKIEGFMSSEKLSKCPIIRRGEYFPKMRYPSRTDNWLTRIGDYEAINNLVKHLKEDR